MRTSSNPRAFDFVQEVTVEDDPGWLPRALADAAVGRFPDPDHRVRIVPAAEGAKAAVVAFTSHHVIASPLRAADVAAAIRERRLQLPTDPRFLAWLSEEVGGSSSEDTIDVVLARPGIARDGQPPMEPLTDEMLADRRIAFAAETRRDLRIHRPDDGTAVVVLGRGFAGRLEMSIELSPDVRGSELADELTEVALAEAGPREAVFAQVSAGNSAALRAAIRDGFKPVGGEYLIR
jgi:hypothetical protein